MYKLSEIQEKYREKLCSAEEAVKVVKSGDRVYYGIGTGMSKELDAALAGRLGELEDLEIISMLNFMPDKFEAFKKSEGRDDILFASLHFGGADRAMMKDGRLWYIPMQFREMPSFCSREETRYNVVMMVTPPMDACGNFNFGPQVADLYEAVAHADKVIVQINKKMPVALGERNFVNIADVDCIVEGPDFDLPESLSKEPTETDKQIATHVVELIESGSTLQFGIGGLPTCIGNLICESDIKDLSGHTEFLTDAFLNLIQAGKMSHKKNVLPGKLPYTVAGGSRALYELLDNNPLFYAAPVDFVNSPSVMASIDKFISVNAFLQIDMFGQVCSESIGTRHFSGTGGQLDFALGAYLSKGGKSFLCAPSTRKLKDGSMISTIVPTLTEGSIVTTPRMAVQYIVTEFGAVNLKGLSTRARAEALVSVAHPDFRDQLIKDCEKLGVWKTNSCTRWESR